MPINTAGVQTDYVVDTSTEVITEIKQAAGDDTFQLVDLDAFISLFHEYYPQSQDCPQKLWHTLMGNEPSGKEDGLNLDVRFLTKDSCHMILEHYKLFISGIDFHHLPSGFFLTKNPVQGGIRDVLHYSSYLAANNPQTTSLSITLSDKTRQTESTQGHGFENPQAQWYEFLHAHMSSGDDVYCTEKELTNAFITFSNTLTRLDLKFYDADFSSIEKDFNPVVLLGRWAAVLTQPNLKKMDVSTQWQALPQLQLSSGYSTLRAITDYKNTENPCGFILPEMFDVNNQPIIYNPIRTITEARTIKTESDIWRYLAYQPKRNSITFYQKGFQVIEAMDMDEQRKTDMRRILIASTSGPGHTAENEAEEENELKIWTSLCSLLDTITSSTMTMRAVGSLYDGRQVKIDFITHLHRPEILPNILFLKSIADYISDYIRALSIADVTQATFTGITPMMPMIKLSDKLDALIKQYRDSFYAGARFYFVDGQWNTLDLKSYIELQYSIDQESFNADKSKEFADLIIPYLSTFNISDFKDLTLKQIFNALRAFPQEKRRDLNYCLDLFKDVSNQQTAKALYKIITDVPSIKKQDKSLMPLLDYVAQNFANEFPEHYFSEKKQQLTDAQSGLNEEQITNVYSLQLSKTQSQAIVSIECALVIKNPEITTEQLNTLNEQLVNLSRVLTPVDFTQFTERLVTIRDYLPRETETLGKLINILCQKRNVEGFSQIYFRNKIEKANDDFLINKCNLFIETLKPLGLNKGTINAQTVQDLLAQIVLNSSFEATQDENYVNQITAILDSLSQVTKAHPHIRNHLLDAFNNILGKNTKDYLPNTLAFIECINALAAILTSGEDELAQKNMLCLFALFAKFHKDPNLLIETWNEIAVLQNPDQQKFLLNLTNCLLENNQSTEGLSELINFLNNNDERFQTLAEHCAIPPYPDIKTINKWLTEGTFNTHYQDYSMRPYGKRRTDFAFKRNEFETQLENFKGINLDLLTSTFATNFEKTSKSLRALPVNQLRKSFAELREKHPLTQEDKIVLLALCIEMLARTTAQYDDEIPPKLISQELNTTQVMALYAMLTNPNPKLISEIETGEGKSRIMMILAATQVAQGKTVDFMTSDMPLAERDYLSYSAFFTALGIRTSLISLNTPRQLYQKGGVNFSDNSQLLLLRNKSDIALDPYAYLEEQEENRCLLIDEVDKFVHDKSKESYNYASQSKNLTSFVWVYPLLVNFVRNIKEKNEGAPFEAESLTDKFVDFVAVNDIDEQHQASIASLNNLAKNQISTWINAARTSLKMEYDKDYKVTGTEDSKLFAIRDSEGYMRYTRKVLVLDNGRPVEGSTFSDGVHQCLCALENMKAGKEEFIINSENQTQRSSYPVSFMAGYEKGTVFGVSGTTRSEAPLANKEINYENYDYLIVPRQKPLRREDKNIWAAKDQQQQIEFIKKAILEQFTADPAHPVLLLCKNDQQSKVLSDALSSDPELVALAKAITRVHALSEKRFELNAIEQAGTPSVLTISTVGMFGRGVDINAANLCVLSAYVPSFEDEKQIKGRTARAGKEGEYRMIPNLSDPDCPLNGATYNINNEVDKVQKTKALEALRLEEISKLYAGFLENIHQHFLSSYTITAKVDQEDVLIKWQKFLDNVQKDWNANKEKLLNSIEAENKEEFITLFKEFTTLWESRAPFMGEAEEKFDVKKANTTYTALLNQKGFFKHERQALKVQKEYDVADDGQARIYSTLFAQERAILRGERAFFADYYAWKEGRGELFPDLMATLNGDRPLFANLIATIARLIEELKQWWAGNTETSTLAEMETPEQTLPCGASI